MTILWPQCTVRDPQTLGPGWLCRRLLAAAVWFLVGSSSGPSWGQGNPLAAPQEYLIQVSQTEAGLPDNTVTGIAQTPEGCLGCATRNGLTRFDGVRFRLFRLEKPNKGMMIHCLRAAYPWWKAAYEEGGAPGILWSDYLCDGFATETQKRELALLRRALNAAAAGIDFHGQAKNTTLRLKESSR